MSLVPDYADSEQSDSDSAPEDSSNPSTCNNNLDNVDQANDVSSASDCDDTIGKTTTSVNAPITDATQGSVNKRLPVPGFLGKQRYNENESSHLPTTSVFSNPFAEAENAKQSALEKHVKMIDGGAALTINGKKICWNYRKGRCRFGHNCKYAHDSDLHRTKEQLAQGSHTSERDSITSKSNNQQRPPLIHNDTQGKRDLSDEPESGNASKKKRPGLSQGLVPGKKVIQQYNKLKTHKH